MSNNKFSNPNVGMQNQVISWINEAGLLEGPKKANMLRKISEILLHQTPELIPTYIENILSYSNDKSTDVKKQVIAFIEELSKILPICLPIVVSQLQLLLADDVIAVQKRVIQCASIVYKNALLWICKGDAETEDMKHVWQQLTEVKLRVLNMIDSDNEGIRTHSIKFLEQVVTLQTHDETGEDDEFSLDDIPTTLPFLKRRALEEESEHIFGLLIKFHNSQHISSVNLMACMTTLCFLAKLRPKYMARVVQALEDLHTTLPPTLSQSQVNSVRKHLKMLLLNLIKHSSSVEMLPQLTQLLLDTGMTSQEITKSLPKERRNKRLGDLRNGDGPTKRFRIDSPQSNSQSSDKSDINAVEDSNDSIKPAITEDTILEGLNNIENVVLLVITTLTNSLPPEMPSDFSTMYKPIPNSGSMPQKKKLAKLINTLIKGESETQSIFSDLSEKIPLLKDDDEKMTLKNAVAKLQETSKADRQVESAVSKLMEETRHDLMKEQSQKSIPPPTPTIPKLKQRVKLLKLQELTQPIPKEIKEKLVIQAVARILNAEKDSMIGGVGNIRTKLITTFASSYTPELRELVLGYILEDPADRIDLGLAWLYEEYAFMQGFNRHPVTLYPKLNEKHDQNYNNLLCSLITQICESSDPISDSTKDVIMRKIYLEVPLVTDEAVDYLKHLVTEDNKSFLALELLEEICTRRQTRAHKFVIPLLSHVINENNDIRVAALNSTLKIYKSSTEAVKKVVEKYAKLYLGFIALNSPPSDLFGIDSGRMSIKHAWTDDLYKMCLNLIMELFPIKDEFILEIARVYGQANADAKRCVLRCMENPIREMASDNQRPVFLQLLEECPRGAETLLTRVVHILTEKVPPTLELVSRVRDLYATRVSDVRFLIPVLNGLTKKEVLAALPKLIKLNPVVVKEVFNKLLGLQNLNEENLPVTPAELLLALHSIDPSKADLKYIIKATALCFAEKNTYTQEVLAVVLQKLMEESEIPVLMMRTVLQALTLYPGMMGLTLNILQRLIEKEVWNHKVAWEGWIKCCERTIPASCTILLSLPAAPLAACLAAAPTLSTALRSHVSSLTTSQRVHIAPHVIAQLTPPSHGAPPTAVPAPVDYQLDQPTYLPLNLGTPIEPLPPGMD